MVMASQPVQQSIRGLALVQDDRQVSLGGPVELGGEQRILRVGIEIRLRKVQADLAHGYGSLGRLPLAIQARQGLINPHPITPPGMRTERSPGRQPRGARLHHGPTLIAEVGRRHAHRHDSSYSVGKRVPEHLVEVIGKRRRLQMAMGINPLQLASPMCH
jgi:hypothetical protein